jgi:hypothetical protein
MRFRLEERVNQPTMTTLWYPTSPGSGTDPAGVHYNSLGSRSLFEGLFARDRSIRKGEGVAAGDF